MIQSKKDYLFYLKSDQLACCRRGKKRPSRLGFGDELWLFQRKMRQMEYFSNVLYKRNIFWRVLTKYLKWRFNILSIKLGFSIPLNTFGPGLSIAHRGTIVINASSRIGANCKIHACVNIGAKAGHPQESPRLSDNCYIGPGAKIFGKIFLADGIAIGANSVVNRSYYERETLLAEYRHQE